MDYPTLSCSKKKRNFVILPVSEIKENTIARTDIQCILSGIMDNIGLIKVNKVTDKCIQKLIVSLHTSN